jgi:hypothetical protein
MHTPSLLLAGAHFNDLTSLALSQQFLHHSSSTVYVLAKHARSAHLYTLLLLSLLLLAPAARVGVLLLVLVVKGALIDLLEKLSPRKQQPHRVCAGCILLTKINIIAAMHISTEPPPSRAALSPALLRAS